MFTFGWMSAAMRWLLHLLQCVAVVCCSSALQRVLQQCAAAVCCGSVLQSVLQQSIAAECCNRVLQQCVAAVCCSSVLLQFFAASVALQVCEREEAASLHAVTVTHRHSTVGHTSHTHTQRNNTDAALWGTHDVLQQCVAVVCCSSVLQIPHCGAHLISTHTMQ